MAKQKVATKRLVLMKDKKKVRKSNSEWEVALWEMLHHSQIHSQWGIDSIAVQDEEEMEE
ncbi:MAG: hypothetical protein HYU02_07000 [Thaumarchaeota archaeon]|nr:hypothetical protein [Nitrososphaerota archaeon]